MALLNIQTTVSCINKRELLKHVVEWETFPIFGKFWNEEGNISSQMDPYFEVYLRRAGHPLYHDVLLNDASNQSKSLPGEYLSRRQKQFWQHMRRDCQSVRGYWLCKFIWIESKLVYYNGGVNHVQPRLYFQHLSLKDQLFRKNI